LQLGTNAHQAAIPGTKKLHYLEENAQADILTHSPQDFEELGKIKPPSGERYEANALRFVNL
jgi:aryl-alcohol dehydrogenase-like predicted oxidoreductase